VDVSPGRAPRTRWGQQFDASIADLFQLQTDIANEVASALNVVLNDSIRHQLAGRPTQDIDAYDAYLRGKEMIAGDITPTVLRGAEVEFRRAVALDSTFAAAWAESAMNHITLFRLGGTQASDAEAARVEVERAIALAPELPDVRAAKGLYLTVVRGDAAGALREYEAALRFAPSRSDLLILAAGAEQILGRHSAALSHRKRAARLDPRSPEVHASLAWNYFVLRRYAEAEVALDRARAQRPTSMSLLYTQALVDVGKGDHAAARRVLQLAQQLTDSTTVVAYVALREELLWLLDDAQQRLLLGLTPAALDSARADWALALAETYWMRGDRRRARAYADTASVAFSALIKTVLNDSDRAMLVALMGLALAYLGREDEAVRRGTEAVAAAQVAVGPPWQDSYIQHQLARIYLLVGEPEKSLDQLEPLLKLPGMISPGWLRIDPTFTPLRGHPRFERLVNGI
jgi:tetratricopeptide (TPR) repeat protein